MIKRIACTLVILITTSVVGFAQDWSHYSFYNGVRVSFPTEPTVVDTTELYKIVFVDTTDIRLSASEEWFLNYQYDKPVSDDDELREFYKAVGEFIVNSSPGATSSSSTVPLGGLLMEHLTITDPESANSCEIKYFLLNQRVYFIRSCRESSELVTMGIEDRFLKSLSVTGDNKRAAQYSTKKDSTVAVGEAIPIIGATLFIAWLFLYVLLIFNTRSSDAPVVMKALFAIVRWTTVALGFVSFVAIVIATFTTWTKIENMVPFAVSAAVVGIITILVAVLRTPSYRKPVL